MPKHVEQFRKRVIRPVLARLNLWSPAAELLLLGTALHESNNLKYIAQVGGGPALGLYQMEPFTLDDLYRNALSGPGVPARVLNDFMVNGFTRAENLSANPLYATAACRLQYWRFPEPLPAPDDALGLARYWKRYWNTEQGAGTPEHFIAALEAASL